MREILNSLFERLNLKNELENHELVHTNIEKDVVFKGTNLWILVFAIIVASVGLNTNSTAVIIGAMLISPLMGPINGMGYSIATYDFPLFRKSVKNFSFAVLASLVASTFYFIISPVSTAHSELLARTSPTIYDVLIAMFGGLAGIVAITSRQKGNVIPGVAIATALMPPLCTAGFGLATGQFNFFFGALYLFTINTVFIAFASLIVSQALKFPIRSSISEAQKKRINQYISLVITLVVIPSLYFGYNLVQNEKFMANANKYVRNISVIDGNYLLKNEINPIQKTITLVYGGRSISDEQERYIKNKTADFSLEKATVNIEQGFAFDEINIKNNEVGNLKSEINRLTLALNEKNNQINELETKGEIGLSILDELQALYPSILSLTYSDADIFTKGKENIDNKKQIIILIETNKATNFSDESKEKIKNWLQKRLNNKEIRIIYL